MTQSKSDTHTSRIAIERIYINMRHLFIRGSYKPAGISGKSLRESLLSLKPEIYGDIDHPEKVELEGMLYVLERLPHGIEECRFIKLTAQEGISEAGHEVIIPTKRRRNCYRIDPDRMYIETTRGRSDIYDILTHLTFLYNESEKIKNQSIDPKGAFTDDWKRLEEVVLLELEGEEVEDKNAIIYLSNVLGRTVREVQEAIEKFENSQIQNSLYHIIYWLGKRAILEQEKGEDREISFSAKLREMVGQHDYGEHWAHNIKTQLAADGLIGKPIHIISANLHSFMNTLYGFAASKKSYSDLNELANDSNDSNNQALRERIRKYALAHGMTELRDDSGTNLTVQIFDLCKGDFSDHPLGFRCDKNAPVLIVMDYAFGEQAYECMDELLKPYEKDGSLTYLNVRSVSIMGKAGILEGDKGDLMIPTAHVFEGTGDNYPFNNELKKSDFEGHGLQVFEGTMITVLGTSLQNRKVLNHFRTSTWNAVGLEMEGAHYQKAIQSAARIRRSISEDVEVLYAYYASDNPLKTGKTLASGSLGIEGVKPTYLITRKILERILISQ